MSDFISRQALLDDIRKTITEKSDTMDWLNMIGRQPTAYDVDKVVEQLRKQIIVAEKAIIKPPADKLDEIANDTAEAFIEAYKDAIEIVKAGGADE